VDEQPAPSCSRYHIARRPTPKKKNLTSHEQHRIHTQHPVSLEHRARLAQEDARLLLLGDDAVRLGGLARLRVGWG
jgi:hypothetical protein